MIPLYGLAAYFIGVWAGRREVNALIHDLYRCMDNLNAEVNP